MNDGKLDQYHLRLLGNEKSQLKIVQPESILVEMEGISQEAHMLNSFFGLCQISHYRMLVEDIHNMY